MFTAHFYKRNHDTTMDIDEPDADFLPALFFFPPVFLRFCQVFLGQEKNSNNIYICIFWAYADQSSIFPSTLYWGKKQGITVPYILYCTREYELPACPYIATQGVPSVKC